VLGLPVGARAQVRLAAAERAAPAAALSVAPAALSAGAAAPLLLAGPALPLAGFAALSAPSAAPSAAPAVSAAAPDLFARDPRALSFFAVGDAAASAAPAPTSEAPRPVREEYDRARNAEFARRMGEVHERLRSIASARGFDGRATDSAAGLLIAPRGTGPAESALAPRPRALADASARLRIRASRFWYYNVPRLLKKWREYRQIWADHRLEGPRAVERPRDLFAETVALGTLRGEVLSYTNYSHAEAIRDAGRIFARYFAPLRGDEAAERALARLAARALTYSDSRQPRKYRDLLTAALRDAALLPADEVRDALAHDATAHDLKHGADFRKEDQGRTLGVFFAAVHETLREEASAAPGRRVVGVVLVGSFASLDQNAFSDFDVKLVTEDGGVARQDAFVERLRARWLASQRADAAARAASHNWDVNPFQYALPLSRRVILGTVGREPHVVLTSDPRLIAALSTGRRLETVGFSETARAGRWARAQKAAYVAFVRALLAVHDLVTPKPVAKMFPYWEWDSLPFETAPSFRRKYLYDAEDDEEPAEPDGA